MPKPKSVPVTNQPAMQDVGPMPGVTPITSNPMGDIPTMGDIGTIDAAGVGAIQQGGNLNAAQQGQALSTIGQNNPYGSLNYTTEIDPITGLPKYTANTNFSADQQALLDNLESNQLGVGSTAGDLIGNTFDQYGANRPDLIGTGQDLTDEAIGKMDPAWERFMGPARDQLDTQLRNQGILPGTPAYQQQMDALVNQQMLTKGQWAAEYQPKAFEMAKSEYGLPLEQLQKMLGLSQPGSLKENFVNTPGANVADTDLAGLYKTEWEQEFQNLAKQFEQQFGLDSTQWQQEYQGDVTQFEQELQNQLNKWQQEFANESTQWNQGFQNQTTQFDQKMKNQQQQNAWMNALMGGGVGLASSIMGMPVNPTGNAQTFGSSLTNPFMKSLFGMNKAPEVEV